MDNRPLIFCHIPKTAGTTFSQILSRMYKREEIYELYGQEGDAQRKVDQLSESDPATRSGLRLVRGHYPVGIHEILPGDWTYVTFMRHPVDRNISLYRHILSTPGHYAYDYGFTEETTIEEFTEMSDSHAEMSNGSVWYLSGGLSSKGDPIKAVESAKQNIDSLFLTVGLTERFDESVILIRRKLGWKRFPVFTKKRVSDHDRSTAGLPAGARAALQSLNRAGMEIFTYAQERLDAQILEYGPDFRSEVNAFRLMNRVYQSIIRLRRRHRSDPATAN